VVATAFVGIMGFWSSLVYAKPIAHRLGGPVLGDPVIALALALLAGILTLMLIRMRAAGIAMTCAAFALAIPLADQVTSKDPAPTKTETHVVLPQPKPTATDGLIAYVRGTTWAQDCVPLSVDWPGLLAATHCDWTDANGVAAEADYFKFAGPIDAESFYEHEIPPAPTGNGAVTCGDDTTSIGTWTADKSRLVLTRSDQSLVVIAGSASAPAADNLDGWDPNQCDAPAPPGDSA
jgi:hypothetical protein